MNNKLKVKYIQNVIPIKKVRLTCN